MSIPQIRDFKRVVFFTGAGMSAQSGVPTYRGKGGIWKEYDHERYACQQAFRRDPEGVWEFHNFRRDLVAKCHPHAGHEVVVAAERANPDGITVVTQNIDGMHQLAGSERVLELHGSLWRVRCESCGARHAGREAPLKDLHCECGHWWRPDIVWFGDMLNDPVVREATVAIERCDLLISIGTSAVVYPAARLPELAKRAGAVLVEINPEPTPVSGWYDHHLRGGASEMLAQMAVGLSPDRG